MTVRVMAIDPGERTGWAIGEIDPEAPELTIVEQGVDQLRDFAFLLREKIEEVDVVVYETWRLYPHMARKLIGNDMQPSQLVGIIRFVSWLNPEVALVSQGATIKKTAFKTMPDDMKRRLANSSEQHDQDAVMHLWFYFWSKYVG